MYSCGFSPAPSAITKSCHSSDSWIGVPGPMAPLAGGGSLTMFNILSGIVVLFRDFYRNKVLTFLARNDGGRALVGIDQLVAAHPNTRDAIGTEISFPCRLHHAFDEFIHQNPRARRIRYVAAAR